MNWDIELAKRFKGDSQSLGRPDVLAGKVLSKAPVKIAIHSGLATLEKEQLYLANGSLIFNYEIGEEVLLVTPDGQVFFIVNRAVKL